MLSAADCLPVRPLAMWTRKTKKATWGEGATIASFLPDALAQRSSGLKYGPYGKHGCLTRGFSEGNFGLHKKRRRIWEIDFEVKNIMGGQWIATMVFHNKSFEDLGMNGTTGW